MLSIAVVALCPLLFPPVNGPLVEASPDEVRTLLESRIVAGVVPNEADVLARMKAGLGESAKFIYHPVGTDPMLSPWYFREVAARDMLVRCRRAAEAGDAEAARDLADKIVSQYRDLELVERAGTEAWFEAARGVEIAICYVNPLYEWVSPRTSAILISDSARCVVVGNDLLRVGDRVPGFPGASVASIEEGRVTFSYNGRETRVEVDGQ